MAAAPPGQELCPHCHKPFKRLRAHLPHCKAAPRPATASAPGPRSNPGLAQGPAATSAPGSSSSLGKSTGSGAVVGPGAGSRPRTGAASTSSKHPPSPIIRQVLPRAAPKKTAAAGGAELPAAARERNKAATEQGGAPSPGLPRQPDGRRAERKVEPAVQDVAKSLDLLPEEVKDLPEKLSNGVKIVIEKHRARVIREKSGSRSGGASAGSHSSHGSPVERLDPDGAVSRPDAAQPGPQEGIAVGETPNTETRGLGAAESADASSKGEQGSSLNATKTPLLQNPPEAAWRSNPGDLLQQEAIDKTVTEEKQMYVEVGVEYKAPLSALHTKNLHLSVREGFRGHEEGASKNYLTSIQKLPESKKQMAAVSQPLLNTRRDPELALHQSLLHTSERQPICPSQASGRSTPAGAMGLEWFPDLHPNYHGLSIFPGKHFQEDVGVTTKTLTGGFAERQQGPLSERHLMDVRLGELPMWLATCDFSPQGLLGGVQKAWSSYYNKYINVKRGGPAGISMLLAGYCLLSYGWNYQHIKGYRWRKYH
ncbi:mitochondrial nucleoid-associated protein 1 [Melanerpes formicivorus]|uniref:mitochondrial nucleoid-associated protein 1 n=1 Tax=Melanerpes formicivorus TaxID=211600 RepID=UPI00358E51FF